MANLGEHVPLLQQGVASWNQWRTENPALRPMLQGADLRSRDLRAYDLSGAALDRADLRGATAIGMAFYGRHGGVSLSGARLDDALFQEADLTRAWFVGATARGAHFDKATLLAANFGGYDIPGPRADFAAAVLMDANLSWATLCDVDLQDSNLSGADLSHARVSRVKLQRACISRCCVYGTACWDAELDGAQQDELRITPAGGPDVRADSLQVAHFVYLMLDNAKLGDILEVASAKTVLVLGRFSPERKTVLDAVRSKLRELGFVAVLADFALPKSLDATQVVNILANLSSFVIADLTDPSSVPQELATIVPALKSIPVVPILKRGARPNSMFNDLRDYDWVLSPYEYDDQSHLVRVLLPKLVGDALSKRRDLEQRRANRRASLS